jgi:hypothetical protein
MAKIARRMSGLPWLPDAANRLIVYRATAGSPLIAINLCSKQLCTPMCRRQSAHQAVPECRIFAGR